VQFVPGRIEQRVTDQGHGGRDHDDIRGQHRGPAGDRAPQSASGSLQNGKRVLVAVAGLGGERVDV
jgi:hypothetical protein